MEDYIDILDLTEDYIETPTTEFEDTEDPSKPFKFEYAMEHLTESNSRFKRRDGN